MKRLVKYLVALLIVLVCIYGFWVWLQYKGAAVVEKTSNSIMSELTKVDTLETATQTFTKTIEGEQQLANLLPGIGVDKIVGSSLFADKMVLDVQGEVHAGYSLKDISTGDIQVSRDGTVTILLGEAQIFGVTLTGTTKTIKLGITTQSDIDMENTLRERAGALIIQEALSGNILQSAKNNAQNILQTLFLTAGIQIKEVILVTGVGALK